MATCTGNDVTHVKRHRPIVSFGCKVAVPLSNRDKAEMAERVEREAVDKMNTSLSDAHSSNDSKSTSSLKDILLTKHAGIRRALHVVVNNVKLSQMLLDRQTIEFERKQLLYVVRDLQCLSKGSRYPVGRRGGG